ncbi:hypothetical protein A9Q99_06960 [Gammaproteobacteria bacterium 45_16_T64]|nr:hypothetical protein A9Q99_06960 [Gammaproteobacteria bacterium 45_16_T64]
MNLITRSPLLLLFSVLFFSIQCHANTSAERVFSTVNQRLSYMEDVARYKHQQHLPVEDLTREKIVLKKALLAAENYGFNITSIQHFFTVQINAAKAIQYRHRADLLAEKNNTQPPKDLIKEVRPALISLGTETLRLLHDYLKDNTAFGPDQYPLFHQSITNRYLSDNDKQLLFDALLNIRLSNN